MKAISLVSIALAASLSVACGGSTPPPAAPETTGGTTEPSGHGEEHAEGGGHHHAGLSPELRDFHSVLKPIWHSEAGPGRVEKACAGTAELNEKAAAVGDAELVAGAKAVEAACAKEGQADVEPQLSALHERFHALLPQKH